MKSKNRFLLVILGLIISSVIFTNQASAQQEDVSFQVFYDQLSPYGQWVDHPDWGYIWLPDVEQDFVPYSTAGYWVLTNYGWTWVSDYEWGWAPFHYGRWDYDNYYGWFWVPDNEWGPAWVTWRSAAGYYGWAPMRPGVSIDLSFSSRYNSNLDHWMFVRDRDLERHDINHYFVNRYEFDRIIGRSRVINRTYLDNRRHSTYICGPGRDEVQRIFGRLISLFTLQDYDRPGHNFGNGRLQMYRPQVKKYSGSRGSGDIGRDRDGVGGVKDAGGIGKGRDGAGGIGKGRSSDGGQKPAPAHVVKRENVKRTSDSPSNIKRNVNPYKPAVRSNQESRQPQNVNRSKNAPTNQPDMRRKEEPTQPQRVAPQPQRVQRDQPQKATPQRVAPQPQKATPPASPQRRVESPQRRVETPQRNEEPAQPQKVQRNQPQKSTPQRVAPQPQKATPPASPQRRVETTQSKEEQAQNKRTR